MFQKYVSMIIFKRRTFFWKILSLSAISFDAQLLPCSNRYLSSIKVSKQREMSAKRIQPPWSPPERTAGVELPNLSLFNSLTGKKEPFIPEKGLDVQWYSCGPTVYDASHMGHARSYITFDILRRVLKDYFKFNVKYVMNITDIDDKIIKRARQQYLFGEYARTKTDQDLEFVLSEVHKSLEKLKSKLSKETDEDKKAMLNREITKINGALNSDASKSVSALLAVAKDALSDLLDSRFGSTVTSNDIFKDLPMHFEKEFHKDMEALNILPVDVLIRISDVVPEVVEYCQKIIDNGFAYESNGSVYFDTIKFSNTPGHFYAKLVPTAFGDQEQLQEGEGVLSSAADRVDEKRSPTDFAVWKAAKPGEPGWDSPWGRGRPGWHIECSVMASMACGSSMDIHTGGVDLRFPHHDNELAQAEAYYCHSHWVRYFLHAGHLTIAGCKMSKSLKNFITIREALEQHSARRLRLAFLLHSWKDTLDYSNDTMSEAISYEKMLLTFFFTVRHFDRLQGRASCTAKMDDVDSSLQEKIQSLKKQVDERLCDSVDTRAALVAIQDFISQCNIYIRDRSLPGSAPVRVSLLNEAARFITKIVRIFGCGDPYTGDQNFGFEDVTKAEVREVSSALISALQEFNLKVKQTAEKVDNQSVAALTVGLDEKIGNAVGASAAGDSKSWLAAIDRQLEAGSTKDPLSVLNPLLTLVAEQREAVRAGARKAKSVPVLQLSDQLRDEVLPQIGVRLEDRDEGQAPAIGLMNRAVLEEERVERLALEEARNKKKQEQMQQKEQQMAGKAVQMRIPPSELFRRETDKYSQFDARGMPTHDTKGNQISKSQLKKLQKLFDAQEKKYNEYLKTQDAPSNGR